MADGDTPITVATPLSDDLIQPFMIEGPALRGRLVRLGPAVDEIIRRHAYPDPVAQMLGETLALAAVLAGALKYEGVFTLQTKGDGPIRLMVADVTSSGHLRGYAQFDEERLAAAMTGPVEAPVPRLLGAGYLAFTVDQGADTDRYQGIVELDGATLADCAHHYFRQSDQLEAAVRTACAKDAQGHWRSSALMLQRIASEGGIAESRPELDDDDDWRRALILMGSAKTAELLDPTLDPDALLFRLFHEDGVRVFPRQPLADRCRCSRHRVETVLMSIPRGELGDLKIDGKVVVTCEFCNTSYAFEDADLDALYGDGVAT